MKKQPTVKGTILRNRPVFNGVDERGNAVSGRVRFSRPLTSCAGNKLHYRIVIELGSYREARGYWTPGKPVDLPVFKGNQP